MPCQKFTNEQTIEQAYARIQLLTRLLCFTIGALQMQMGEKRFAKRLKDVPELATWWEKHQAEDRERRERERRREIEKQSEEARAELRRSAAEKLTPEERSALGLTVSSRRSPFTPE